jgi:hypothetical protein
VELSSKILPGHSDALLFPDSYIVRRFLFEKKKSLTKEKVEVIFAQLSLRQKYYQDIFSKLQIKSGLTFSTLYITMKM